MAPILLLAGLLLLLYGLASLSTAKVAASRRMREHSRVYAVLSMVAGVGCVGVGLVMLLS